MFISDLLHGLLRRWYVIVAGFVLTAAGAYLVFDATPVQYESHATMMLLPPEESLGIEGSNPYLILGGMGQALAVLTTRLNSPETRERVLGDLEEADYGAAADTMTGAPFLALTAQAASEDAALELLTVVQDEAETHLAGMQAELDVPAASEIGMMHVTSDIEATKVGSTQMQLTLATIGAGLVITVLVAAMVDGLARSRSRKRAAALVPPRRERGPREPMRAREALGGGLGAPVEDAVPDDLGDGDDLDANANANANDPADVLAAGRSNAGGASTRRAERG